MKDRKEHKLENNTETSEKIRRKHRESRRGTDIRREQRQNGR